MASNHVNENHGEALIELCTIVTEIQRKKGSLSLGVLRRLQVMFGRVIMKAKILLRRRKLALKLGQDKSNSNIFMFTLTC